MMPAMRQPRHASLLLVLFLGLAGLAPEARAYLDPSTGSMILSAIVGLFATLGLAIKTYWYKLKNLLTRRSRAAAPGGQVSRVPGDNRPDPASGATKRPS